MEWVVDDIFRPFGEMLNLTREGFFKKKHSCGQNCAIHPYS